MSEDRHKRKWALPSWVVWLADKWTHRKRMLKTDKLAWFIVANSVAWVWCSYIFAYKGVVDIVETVSRYVVTEVIVVFAAAVVKNFGENLSKHNTWPDKQAKEDKADDVKRDC